MNPVAQLPEDNQPPEIQMLPRREHLTAVQIGNILSVLNVLGAFLRQSDEENYGKPEQDGGVKSAVAASVYHTLNRLDTIINDSSRWGLESHVAMERLIAANLKANISVAEQHAMTQEYLRLPHVAMRPTISRLDDGSFIAYVGGIKDELIGFGDTPIEALAAFDAVILGDIDHKQQYDKIQTLDRKRNSTTPRRKGKRGIRERDSEKPGADGQGS